MGKNKILIIEDDVFLSKTYEAKLRNENIDIFVVHDGKEALSHIAEQEKPALVLLDLMLPIISGFEVLEEIRKHPKWKEVPVIVLTNLGQPQDKEHAEKLGIEKYIIKMDTRIGDIVEEIKKYLK